MVACFLKQQPSVNVLWYINFKQSVFGRFRTVCDEALLLIFPFKITAEITLIACGAKTTSKVSRYIVPQVLIREASFN